MLTISDAHLSSGAGYIVAVAGNMLLMPGLPKVPQAVKMHVADDGTISGRELRHYDCILDACAATIPEDIWLCQPPSLSRIVPCPGYVGRPT